MIYLYINEDLGYVLASFKMPLIVLAFILSLTIAYGQNIKKLMSRIRKAIQQEVEYTTGMAVEILKITVRGISQPEH